MQDTINSNVRLTYKDYSVILDVLNMFDENDVKAVAPSMATEEFVNDVNMVFRKVYKIKKKKAKTRAL